MRHRLALLPAHPPQRWSQGTFSAGSAQAAQQASPLIMGIAATLIAYSLVYSSGLLLRMRQLASTQSL